MIREFIGKEIVPKVNITEKEAKEYYDKNTKQYLRPEEVKAQHILIKTEKGDSEEKKAEARKKLTELKKQIDAGADFGELAKANSQCPSAPNGGDLGYFSKGRMVPEFEKAAFALKTNEVSGIVETQFGYHLIKVTDHKAPEQQKFDEVKSRIMNELRNKKIQADAEAYAAGLRKAAKIEILTK
ncbi:MAG: peptidyl-prolyl cis-trans isomerase [Desulfobacteraceae bacterium]|nr:peptidyl-prolyl cis-trans isomerase [Desulfobacteraceae bacterium]